MHKFIVHEKSTLSDKTLGALEEISVTFSTPKKASFLQDTSLNWLSSPVNKQSQSGVGQENIHSTAALVKEVQIANVKDLEFEIESSDEGSDREVNNKNSEMTKRRKLHAEVAKERKSAKPITAHANNPQLKVDPTDGGIIVASSAGDKVNALQLKETAQPRTRTTKRKEVVYSESEENSKYRSSLKKPISSKKILSFSFSSLNSSSSEQKSLSPVISPLGRKRKPAVLLEETSINKQKSLSPVISASGRKRKPAVLSKETSINKQKSLSPGSSTLRRKLKPAVLSKETSINKQKSLSPRSSPLGRKLKPAVLLEETSINKQKSLSPVISPLGRQRKSAVLSEETSINTQKSLSPVISPLGRKPKPAVLSKETSINKQKSLSPVISPLGRKRRSAVLSEETSSNNKNQLLDKPSPLQSPQKRKRAQDTPNTEDCRQSSRMRAKPIDYWLGKKPEYHAQDGSQLQTSVESVKKTPSQNKHQKPRSHVTVTHAAFKDVKFEPHQVGDHLVEDGRSLIMPGVTTSFCRLPPGADTEYWCSYEDTKLYTVLESKVHIEIDGLPKALNCFDQMHILKGIKHRFMNNGNKKCLIQCITIVG